LKIPSGGKGICREVASTDPSTRAMLQPLDGLLAS
jgi:hypothetical protein